MQIYSTKHVAVNDIIMSLNFRNDNSFVEITLVVRHIAKPEANF